MTPALHLHQSNRLERLADALADELASERGDPLAPRHVLCQSAPLGRWLRHRLCRRHGVAMLVETGLPAGWLWRTAALALNRPQGDDPLSRERMHWRIHALLGTDSEPLEGRAGDPLHRYLHEDRTGLKRWQLAGRIADVFDRYQYHRPDLIRRWTAGADPEDWQAGLWRALLRTAPWHRVQLLDEFVEALRRGDALPGLPARLDLFSTHNLPPLLLEAFAALSVRLSVHLWLLAPTPEYWADLASARTLARKRLEQPEEARYWQAGHPLLTHWGRQGQVFQDLLLQLDTQVQEGLEAFDPPEGDTLLANVQAAVCRATEEPTEPREVHGDDPDFPSIQVHVCHGPMRECQVLHDTLLHCLARDPSLEPEDVLVLVPDISRYAPYIEAVFGREPAEGEHPLPFNLSDVVFADEHPLVRCFLQLLELPESRFTRAEVLAWLDAPEVRARFGLEDASAGDLAELFDRLRVYWGLDGADKRARLGLPGIDENTWAQAFRRVMAGFALGGGSLYGDIAPQPEIGAGAGDQAARFFELLETLRAAARTLDESMPPHEWARRLSNLLHALFGPEPDEDGRLDRIREALGELAEVEDPAPLSPAVVRHWLEGRLGSREERGRFYSGGVTFCAMQPLRGVPFRVIGVLGLQDAAFPRRRRPVEFDRMAERWRHGDPDPALEDRHLFLETLLAARERLLLSYTGRDARSNEPLQPSVVLQELVDHLNARYRIQGRPAGECIQRVHPLQPFGRANYTGAAPRSFDRRGLATARAILGHTPPAPHAGWPDLALEPPEMETPTVSPQELVHFFRHPVRHFFRRRLRLTEPGEIAAIEDEPLELDGLEAWALRQRVLEEWLTNGDQAPERLLRAEGALPHGTPGARILRATLEEARGILARANIQPPLAPAPVDLSLHLEVEGTPWEIAGRITGHYASAGLLHVSASKFHLADLLALWIPHLCLAAAGRPAPRTLWLCRDHCVQLLTVEPGQARTHLAELLAVYRKGLERPLPFFRSSASAWAEHRKKKPADSAGALGAAQKTWRGNRHRSGESGDFYAQILLRGREWEPDEGFAALARRILDPIQAFMSPP